MRELEGRSPSRPPRPREGGSRLILIRMRPSRALLVGPRPPTPQSPEGLRSTPFDCVAIAPCCFAERKTVLSHALAALTALGPVRGQSRGDMLRGALRAWAREKDGVLWEFPSLRRPCLKLKHGQSRLYAIFRTL